MKSDNTYLFMQCLIDTFYPNVGTSVAQILNNYCSNSLYFPAKQTCCGQPMFNAGYWREATIAAKKFIKLFENAKQIVSPSGSCVAMVKNHFPQLFENNNNWLKRSKHVASKTYELSEFLVDILGVSKINSTFCGKITYQDSCHLLRELGIKSQPRELLKNIPDVDLIEMNNPEDCCGFGGAFAFKHPDLSTTVLEQKVNDIMSTGADIVTGCDISCLMNIQGMLHYKNSSIRVMHIAQILNYNTN